jgi:hypothetical protein
LHWIIQRLWNLQISQVNDILRVLDFLFEKKRKMYIVSSFSWQIYCLKIYRFILWKEDKIELKITLHWSKKRIIHNKLLKWNYSFDMRRRLKYSNFKIFIERNCKTKMMWNKVCQSSFTVFVHLKWKTKKT